MTSTLKAIAAVAGSLLLGAGGAAHAALIFPSASSSWSAPFTSGTGVPTDPMFDAGNNITQTFTGTGLGAVGDLTYSFPVADNLGGSNVTLDILINGTTVDTQTVLGCGGCGSTVTESNSVTFPTIVGGGTYTLTIELANTVPFGDGNVIFPDVGSFTLSSASVPVPEPSGLLLLVSGLVGLALLHRRTA